MFCREQVARLASRTAEIRAAGAELIAIGNGTPPFAAAFLDEMPVAFPVYTDPSRQSYRAFDMRRSRRGLLKPKTWRNARRALASGHRQSRVRGDPWQNGGVVVVEPGGRVVFSHVESESGDLADLDAVIRAIPPSGASSTASDPATTS